MLSKKGLSVNQQSTDSIDAFVAAARQFQTWITTSELSSLHNMREALIQVTQLYLAALHLPPPWNDELPEENPPDLVSADEVNEIFARALQLPLTNYSEIFDPIPIPAEEPVVGNLADDLSSVFRHVAEGLRLFDSGRKLEAVWEWGFSLQSHWGEHATSAIRAMHCYLAQNDQDLLTASDSQ